MQDDTIEIHIRAATRPSVETRRLLTDLLEYCWPGGPTDQSDPVARGWLRYFAPLTPLSDLPECTCRLGHCTVCN